MHGKSENLRNLQCYPIFLRVRIPQWLNTKQNHPVIFVTQSGTRPSGFIFANRTPVCIPSVPLQAQARFFYDLKGHATKKQIIFPQTLQQKPTHSIHFYTQKNIFLCKRFSASPPIVHHQFHTYPK